MGEGEGEKGRQGGGLAQKDKKFVNESFSQLAALEKGLKLPFSTVLSSISGLVPSSPCV